MRYFISYTRNDSDFVIKLSQELRDSGADLWLDQFDIVGGEHWDKAIEKALHLCNGMIVILSPISVSSDNVLDEVSYALEEGKKVIPVLYQQCDFPFRLRRLQYIDFTKEYKDGFGQLLRALRISPATEQVVSTDRDDSSTQTNLDTSTVHSKVPPHESSDESAAESQAPEEKSVTKEFDRATDIESVRIQETSKAGKRPAVVLSKVRWQSFFIHLLFGFGLIYFNRRLRRGWVYVIAFIYSAIVGCSCGMLSILDLFCGTAFSFQSFIAGIAIFALGFIDIALGAYFQAKRRQISFWM